ncbi:MAG: ATP-binding cassette domain-containing protein [Byssovorax sp.]
MPGPVLELASVSRRFGDCVAVDRVSLTLGPGEIHAVIGENGAGKSTLMKLAAGVLAPSGGKVLVDGRELAPATPAEAIRRGIGMVHQHFMLVGAFRAIENMILGSEPVLGGGRLDLASARRTAETIMESAGLSIPLDAITDDLTVGERQRLEILRVLARGARALLLDEPTAVLSPLEAEELYGTLRKLADGGSTIAVVTHRLDEVTRFADRVTVMRRGKQVLSRPHPRGSDQGDELTRAIMGGEPPPPFVPPALPDDAAPVLAIEKLSLRNADGHALLDGVDLKVRAGEIVGVAGVEGNGQRELVRAIAGLEPHATGRVLVDGRDLGSLTVRARRPLLGVVHEDRHAEGLLLDATVGDNLILGDLGDGAPGFDEAGTIGRRIQRFRVQPPDPARLAGELSGGNQQKIVLGRALDRLKEGARAVAVLAQPTRGVDVGAAAAIHAAIGEAAAAGLGVLLISADLGELRRLSHRLVVMRRGKVVKSLPPDASETEIGRAMLGMEAA